MTAPTLRPYQLAAVEAIREAYIAGQRSILIVLATGLGKTVIAAEVIRRSTERGRRVLFLAHRTELLEQALGKLTACGVRAQIEQGERRAAQDAPCVVASVQTLRGPRLERWAADAFDLIVVDEAHHAVADGYRSILGRFQARVLGVTATPDRLDGQGMSEVFQGCAYRYDLRQAIRDGWLAPIRARRVAVDGLDLAGIHTKAGDLDRSELATVMAEEGALHGVAVPLLELAGDRRSIVFAVDVAHARALTEVLNRYEVGIACAVDGSASADERARVLRSFRDGEFRVLVNCALFTEGFDEPSIACVAVARPTKSRALYAQMVGRGTRLHPGKADCLVLDFTGSAGRHRLVGPADVLAGREISDDVRALVGEVLTSEAGDVNDVLEEAEASASEQRERAKITAIARYRAEAIDPFVGALPDAPRAAWATDLATEAQREALTKAGLRDLPDELTKGEASRWLDAIAKRRNAGLATIKQVRKLRGYGINGRAMRIQEASEELDRIAANAWKGRAA